MKNILKISIIIPVKKINPYLYESVPKILNLNWPDFEIIIFTDKKETQKSWPKTKIIASGKTGPAQKRDLALKYALGDILAFLDDDAYPKSNWLSLAVKHFKDKKVAAVGGPAITPKTNSLLQKALGAVCESYIGSGGARNRFIPLGKAREIDDWPTVNLLVRKDVFKKVKGFDTNFWPGEDTKLCLDIIKKGYKIIYEPKAIVYHHRRNNIANYLKQIGNYGIHRGYFVKKFPQTSFKLWYFCPFLFLIYLFTFFFLIFFNLDGFYLLIFSLPFFAYLLAILIDGLIISIRWKNFLIGIITIPMIFLTHIWYGFKFIKGLLIKELKT